VIDDRAGDLLCAIAAGLRSGERETDEWIAWTDELDEEIEEGRRVLGQARESGRLNPRPAKRRRMRVARRRRHRPARRGHHLTPTDGGFGRVNA
jgi:hypothetical protein